MLCRGRVIDSGGEVVEVNNESVKDIGLPESIFVTVFGTRSIHVDLNVVKILWAESIQQGK